MTDSHWLFDVALASGADPAANPSPEAGASIAEAWASTGATFDLNDDELAGIVARRFRLPVADLAAAEPPASRLLPVSLASRYKVFALRQDYRHLVIAVSDPTDVEVEQAIGFASGRTVVFEVAAPALIEAAIAEHYAPDRAVEALLMGLEDDAGGLVEVLEEEVVEPPPEAAPASGPVVRLTNLILEEAVKQGASDVHVQPFGGRGAIRLRVDGLLRSYMRIPISVLTRVIARIKVLGKLDIADRHRPQDGRAQISVKGRRFDLRISTVPTRGLEKAVVRILDTDAALGLDDVGFTSPELGLFRSLLQHRDGIIVVTGPTGSGKTITLYAALREVSEDTKNIMTVEDPVEYELPEPTQVQVEAKRGVTFPTALRAILRQDPDVILVGEVRDRETAEVAAHASLTGHLVLTTLHSNDATGVVQRFADLGLLSSSIVSTLRGGLAQRLVRRVCQACVEPADGHLTEEETRLAARYGMDPTVRVVGCPECSGSGHRGRAPVVEVFVMTEKIREMVLRGDPPALLRAAAADYGMRSLRSVALELVDRGTTTLHEVDRVLGPEHLGGADEAQTAPGLGEGSFPPTTDASIEVSDPETHRAKPWGDAPGDKADLGSVRILVVDDDAGGGRHAAKTILQREGFLVSEAADGFSALQLLAVGDYALMVLDLHMPSIDGMEVLRRVRSSVRTAALPVIVMTGTPDDTAEARVMEAGADDYVRKPFDAPLLVTRVEAALTRSVS